MNLDLKKRMEEYTERKNSGEKHGEVCPTHENVYHRARCAGAKRFCVKHDAHIDEEGNEIAPDKIFYIKHDTAGCKHSART